MRNSRDEKYEQRSNGSRRGIYAFILLIVSVLFCIVTISGGKFLGIVGSSVFHFLLGVFGFIGYVAPFLTLFLAIGLLVNFSGRFKRLTGRHLTALILLIVVAVFSAHLFSTAALYNDAHTLPDGGNITYGSYLAYCYNAPKAGTPTGGGLLSGILVYPIGEVLGYTGTVVILVLGFFLALGFLLDSLISKGIAAVKKRFHKVQEDDVISYPVYQNAPNKNGKDGRLRGGAVLDDQYREFGAAEGVPVVNYQTKTGYSKKSAGLKGIPLGEYLSKKQSPAAQHAATFAAQHLYVEDIDGSGGLNMKSKKEMKNPIIEKPKLASGKNPNVYPSEKSNVQNLLGLKGATYTSSYSNGVLEDQEELQKKVKYILDKPTMYYDMYPAEEDEDAAYYAKEQKDEVRPPKIVHDGEEYDSDDSESYLANGYAESEMSDHTAYRSQSMQPSAPRKGAQSSAPVTRRRITSADISASGYAAQPAEDMQIEGNEPERGEPTPKIISPIRRKGTAFQQLRLDFAGEEGATDVKFTVSPQTKQAKPKKRIRYVKPPVDLLQKVSSDPLGHTQDYFEEKAQILADTLRNFKIDGIVQNIVTGPTVTRYEIQMPPGVKVRKIIEVKDDIAMNLSASGSIRIQAPVPGKNVVGIEIPNDFKKTVPLRDVIESKSFIQNPSPLAFAVGQDVAGGNIVAAINKMPHLLVAGTTGMGKSVCLNTLIVSLLYKASPDDVKLILIDPKSVEFSIYNGLPHLLLPKAITDTEKALSALDWAISEMERRFKLLEGIGAKEIVTYNAKCEDFGQEKLPFIVVIVDEFNDLMMRSKSSAEDKIVRLAQKSRAAGIHLILATQRPTTDVISGGIKNNIPARIALKVVSPVDSITILGTGGAEELLGKGDMLIMLPTSPELKRLQGAFVTDKEVEDVVAFVKEHNTAYFDNAVQEAIDAQSRSDGKGIQGRDNSDLDTGLIRMALEFMFQSNKVSINFLQTKLAIGYPKASRLIDKMEELGYITPSNGSEPRKLLISKEEFDRLFNGGGDEQQN